jgi:NADH:ubiquinone oxidoreductase subunit 5 (subunit L)/multisubunit Na+/H+ antiporter MnhA subunit
MSFWRQTLTIMMKDLRAELRTKEAINASFSFALVILLLFSFAFDPSSEQLHDISGGLLWLVFGGTYRGGAIVAHGHDEAASEAHSTTGDPLAQVHEPGLSMFIPMVVLAVLSLLGGFYGTPWNDWIGEFLSPTVHSVPGLPTSDPRFWIADAVGLGMAILGIGFAWLRYGRGQISVSEKEAPAVAFVRSGLGIDALYSAVIVRPLLALGRGLQSLVEGRVLDGGTRDLGGLFAAGSRGLRTLQTGYARNYAVWIFLGAALILLYLMISPQLR